MKGIGYQEYRLERKLSENLQSSKIEDPGNERYLLYFGRAHVIDHETDIPARGPLKVGRGKFATALMRGRNQPGIDFRIYAEIIFETDQATFDAEKLFKAKYGDLQKEMSQNQKECYDIPDSDIKDIVDEMVRLINTKTDHTIKDVKVFI